MNKNRREIISSNLNVIKALAIIWVVIYHLPVECNLPVLGGIKSVGYGGVDFFIFLAGFGLYHSLEKNDIGTYAFRRLKAILPFYIPFILVFLVVQKLTYQLYLTEAVGNLTMTGWLAGNPGQFNWYVAALPVLYVLAPIVHGVVKKSERFYTGLIIFIGLTLFISVNFWHTELLLLATRIPLFVLGFYFADTRIDSLLNKKISLIGLNAATVAGIAMLAFFLGNGKIDKWHYGTWWYPFLLIVPGLVVDIALLGELLRKKISLKLLDRLGKVTFSVYLWHIWVFTFMPGREKIDGVMWLVVAVLTIACSWIYHILVGMAVEKITKLISKKN